PSEYSILYKQLDEYLASDACKKAFATNTGSGIDYSLITLCVDEAICEEFNYPNSNKIRDKVNALNGKNDFNKALIAIKNKSNAVVHSIKYFDLPK
ncbi:MAG TPA: hypothetical protein VK796_08035, partial [Cytophaga sp.]|nr:hypothetical protein [Cytophaga sp.]